MKRFHEAIEDLKKDYNNLIYDLGNLIVYVKKDWDQEPKGTQSSIGKNKANNLSITFNQRGYDLQQCRKNFPK